MTSLQVDVAALNYSPDEYNRWDAYTPGNALYAPIPSPVSNSAYMQQFQKVLTQHYQMGYTAYSNIIRGNYDLNMVLTGPKNILDESNVLTYVSFSLNEAYNIARINAATGTAIVDFNWLANPQVAKTLDWLEKYLRLVFAVQNLEHTDVNGNPLDMTSPTAPALDTYGLYRVAKAYGIGYNLSTHIWYSWKVLTILCRYAALFSTPFLQLARAHIYASMTAQFNNMTREGSFGIQTLNSQWLQSITGVCLHTTFILQSQQILMQRGYFHQSDISATSNRSLGVWSNADLISLSTSTVNTYLTYLNKYYIREFISSYVFYSLNMLIKVLLYPPTEDIYNSFVKLFRLHWWDIAANYFPAANCMSSPMNRTYRNFCGCPEVFDQLYTNPFVTPYLLANRVPTIPINGLVQYDFHIFAYCMRVLGGCFYAPEDKFNTLTSVPLRVNEALFSNVQGQARYNYVTPNFTIGHAGEDYYLNSNNSLIAARLGGARNTTNPAPAYTNCVGIVRFMVDSTDDPCQSTGQGQQLSGRLLCAQYQNFLLTTSLIYPSSNSTETYPTSFPYCLNTNIMLPLCVDALWVNGVPLPTSVGTVMAIPPNSVFTVQHGGAALVVKVVVSTNSATSKLLDAKSAGAVSSFPQGYEPYSLMWLVQPDGYALGTGRVVIHHKHPSDPSMAPYFVSTVIGALDTPAASDVKSFTQYMMGLNVTSALTSNHDGVTAGTTSNWTVQTRIGTNVLQVTRQEIFQSDNDNWNAYNDRPYRLITNARTVNEVPMLQFAETDAPFRSTPVKSLYKPF